MSSIGGGGHEVCGRLLRVFRGLYVLVSRQLPGDKRARARESKLTLISKTGDFRREAGRLRLHPGTEVWRRGYDPRNGGRELVCNTRLRLETDTA